MIDWSKNVTLLAMAREVDFLNAVEVPEDYEVLDAAALARRLGLKRQSVQAYMSRGWWHLVPRPNRTLTVGPIWYAGAVRRWEESRGGNDDGR